MVQATGRQLIASSVSQKLQERLQRGEIHPGGPLPGRPGHCLQAEGEAAALEAACLQEAHLQAWADALGGLGLNAGRRALRVLPAGLVWEWRHSQRVLELRFRLPAGAYATSLTRIFHPLLAFPGGQWMEDVVPRTGRGKAREGLFSRLQAHLSLTPIVCQRAGAALTGGYPGTSRSATVQNRR